MTDNVSVLAENDRPEVTFCFNEQGGPASALGFKACGVHAGFRDDPERLDMALIVADEPAAAAATFTRNVFCAAPVRVSREHLSEGASDGPAYGCARAVVVNSGIANAATGERGLQTARDTAALVADAVGCRAREVLIASTGVIGQHLPLEPFSVGTKEALAQMATQDTRESREVGGLSAARAIMTTDTHPKHASVSFSGDDLGYPGVVFTVGGMAKGSGMIMPNMATMIAVITTDAPLTSSALSRALSRAVANSFNKVTVDSDTSTNDTCFALASGAAAPTGPVFESDGQAFLVFQLALEVLCQSLARDMASDGEGATRLVTVKVQGAATAADADAAARTIANSPLVKTAIYGHDANWGRIAAALGRSGAHFNQEDVDIDMLGLPALRSGLPVAFDEEEALRRFENPEIALDVNLHAGDESTTIWTCDFSHEYVSINGDYRS